MHDPLAINGKAKWFLPQPPQRNVPVHAGSRRVQLLSDPDDFACVLLASLGFSTELIMRKTGLSAGQVLYRLKKADVSRASYRNGKTALAQTVVQNLGGYAAKAVKQHVALLDNG